VSTTVDCVVVGAGLSGLTAAYRLHQQGYSVAVVDGAKQTGGVIQTLAQGPYLCEAGPNTFLSTAVEINALVNELGLAPVSVNPDAKDRFIWRNGRLHPVPRSVMGFLKTPLLSPLGKVRLLAEPFISKAATEESIAQFTQRRLGNDALDYMMAPFLTGIYAGDPAQLSLKAVFPKLWQWEQTAGSLMAGALAQARQKKKELQATNTPKAAYRLLSFECGMTELIDALVNHLPEDVRRFGTSITDLSLISNQVKLRLYTGESILSRTVILATPAGVSGQLLEPLIPVAAIIPNLTQIDYAPMAVVHLAFKKSHFKTVPQGFGFLIPPITPKSLLGAIYTSSLFPNRCPEDEILLTCFAGGALNVEAFHWHDDDLISRLQNDLTQTVGLLSDAQPTFKTIIRWPNAIPQYTLGHFDRVATIQEYLLEHHPQICLAGNYLAGVSVNDCVKSGEQAVKQIEKTLQKIKMRSEEPHLERAN